MTKGRNIAIFLDGTWNTPESRTNVYTLYEQAQGLKARNLPRQETASVASGQLKYYDQGVGTMWGNLLRGGAFGHGLDRNLGEAFGFLSTHYRPGDDIYIFGFSRGAYTARSLSGLISRYGLVDHTLANNPRAFNRAVDDAVNIYRQWPKAPNGGEAELDDRNTYHVRLRAAEARLADMPRLPDAPRIRFLGVWDTVGALGLPRRFRFGDDIHDRYAFHDTGLSPLVDHAYHALAIDEHRPEFNCVLWSRRYPENQDVEQRWFVGAHADVGGGYLDNYLNHYPRRWMQQKADALGLAFFHPLEPRTDVLLEPVSDSYSAFAFGLLKKFTGGRFYRSIHSGAAIDEVIDYSVAEYLKRHRRYRPANLPKDFLDRALADLPESAR